MTEETKPQHNGEPAEEPSEAAPTEQSPPPPEDLIRELETLRQKLDEVQKNAETFKDHLLRKAAEFENFKRRTEAESLTLIRTANEYLLSSLLPVVDDLQRSLKAGAGGKDPESFYRGIELVAAKFMKILQQQGVTPFESAGKPFDVDYHDALLQVETPGTAPGTVLEEVDRGYMLYDRILRHAKVVVAAAPHKGDTPAGAATGTDA
jgi:molecular chaperone GrpE